MKKSITKKLVELPEAMIVITNRTNHEVVTGADGTARARMIRINTPVPISNTIRVPFGANNDEIL